MQMRHRVAVALLLIASPLVSVEAQQFPFKHGDKPPSLAGFHVYDSASVRERLGKSVTIDTLGDPPDPTLSYSDTTAGITIVVSHLDGVAIIYVTQREAGMIDSIRVGDTRERVLARWGAPTRTDGSNALWIVDDWVVVVQLGPGNQVVRLGVGRQG